LERLVLPARVPGYAPAMLDELCSAGEVVWAGAGALAGNDGWVALSLAENAALLLPAPTEGLSLTPTHTRVLEELSGGNALFFRALADRVGASEDLTLVEAIWDLVWAGLVTNDTLAPLRTVLGLGRHGLRAPTRAGPPALARHGRRGGLRGVRSRAVLPTRSGPPTVVGRWSLAPERDADPTRRAHAQAEALLDRHGVLTRGAVAAEAVPGGFAAAYRVLSAFEESGRARRGYFVEGLGAAQFAMPGAVDRLRTVARQPRGPGAEPPDAASGQRTLVLAATDPANAYGAALPWPERAEPGERPGHRPGRKAGALVVLTGGVLVLYVERGGRSLLTFTEDENLLAPAAAALAESVRAGALGRLTVERADGGAVADSPLGHALSAAGFHATPRGLRLRG
jgi:ATP-dependent Lhr-like helicase